MQVSVYRAVAPFDEVVADVERTDANTVTVRTQVVPVANEYRVVVAGTSLAAGDKNYVHNQSSPGSTWTVASQPGQVPRGRRWSTAATRSCMPNVIYLDTNTVQLTSAPQPAERRS